MAEGTGARKARGETPLRPQLTPCPLPFRAGRRWRRRGSPPGDPRPRALRDPRRASVRAKGVGGARRAAFASMIGREY